MLFLLRFEAGAKSNLQQEQQQKEQEREQEQELTYADYWLIGLIF